MVTYTITLKKCKVVFSFGSKFEFTPLHQVGVNQFEATKVPPTTTRPDPALHGLQNCIHLHHNHYDRQGRHGPHSPESHQLGL